MTFPRARLAAALTLTAATAVASFVVSGGGPLGKPHSGVLPRASGMVPHKCRMQFPCKPFKS